MDFNRLRLAALQRFIPMEHVPEPPAAAPLRPLGPASSTALPKVGHIKAYDLSGKVLGFIGDANPQQCPLVAASTEGIIVEYHAQAGGLSLMKVVSDGPHETNEYLGLRHHLTVGVGPEILHWVLSFCSQVGIYTSMAISDSESTPDAVRQACIQEPKKELSSRVWSLDPSTLDISASWIESNNEATQLELGAIGSHLWL
ncbi:hypothetical protein FRB94_001177 [Tulasnella sp. JGI-2019a]|nr:hypothetical protein FRB93_012002 [Tulasnella sp. JGI-2019a]KAG8988011.1 hypothetical protein FRB94_001177 [Tulasnella sp. JGI-2019a]KAG9022051.1 hypothetical protein FRB95_000947 [Tulasnella sp. JGI-2019a]